MNLRNLFLLISTCFGICGSIWGGEHHTRRFLYPESRSPKTALALTISPNGDELAVCVDPETVHFIRLTDGEQISQITARPFAMRYSRDGSRVMIAERYDQYVIATRTRQRAKVDTREIPGFLGLAFVERNGKLLIDRLDDGGPAAESGELLVGDEIVRLSDGKSGPWVNVVGMTVQQLTNRLKGPVQTYVRLQALRKGKAQAETVLLQRRTGKSVDGKWTFLPAAAQDIQDNLVTFQRGERHTFVSAFDGTAVGSFAPESIRLSGQFAIAPDQKRFAALSFVRDKSDQFAIEIHDLITLERAQFFPFERSSFYDIAFSTDGRELLVATRDRVDVLDSTTGKFQRTYRLDGEVTTTFEDDAPKRNRVTFNGSVGNAVAGAAYDRIGDIGWTPPQKLASIAVSSALLATATPDGQVDVWDLKTGSALKSVPLGPVGGLGPRQRQVDFLQFSDDGHWLVFYVNGVLNIVEVRDLVSTTASK